MIITVFLFIIPAFISFRVASSSYFDLLLHCPCYLCETTKLLCAVLQAGVTIISVLTCYMQNTYKRNDVRQIYRVGLRVL